MVCYSFGTDPKFTGSYNVNLVIRLGERRSEVMVLAPSGFRPGGFSPWFYGFSPGGTWSANILGGAAGKSEKI